MRASIRPATRRPPRTSKVRTIYTRKEPEGIDHLYVMGATYPRVTTMIAANSEFYRSKFSFVFGLNKVIPKKNYYPDPPLPNFQRKALTELVNDNECVARIPFLRETTAYINLVGIFKFGKVTFRIQRTNEFVNYLYDKQIC